MKIVMLERMSVGADIDVSRFAELGEFVPYDITRTKEEVAERIADADAVIVNKAPMNEESMRYSLLQKPGDKGNECKGLLYCYGSTAHLCFGTVSVPENCLL